MYQQTCSWVASTARNDTPQPQCTVTTLTRQHRAPATDPRYADLKDRYLAEQLASEDAAVEAGLSPFERLTCPAHRRWLHQCIASPQHVIPVSGHRWCRDCQTAATIAIDELTGDVTVTCPRCHRTPEGIATRQIVRACRASLATAHDARRAGSQRGPLAFQGRRTA